MPWKFDEEGQWIEVGDDGNPVGWNPLRTDHTPRDPKDTGWWPGTILRGNDPLSRLAVPSPNIPKPTANDILEIVKQRVGASNISSDKTQAVLADIRAALSTGTSTQDIIKYVAGDIAASIKKGQSVLDLGKEAAASGTDKQSAIGDIVTRPDGTIINTQTGITVAPDGTTSRLPAPARDAAAQGADAASAANSYAQAARAAAMTTIDANNAAKAGTQTGLGPGYTWKSDGSFALDGNLTSRDKEDIQRVKEDLQLRRDIFKDESANRANLLKNDTARLANDTTRTGYEGQRVGIEGQRAAADERYQQGQLQQGQSRLDMDRAAAASEAAFKSNQSALARDEYTSKVLSSPADFIARAFNQRGETSPSKPITQADLINTVNQQYQQAPTQFVAPRLPTYAMGTTAPTLPTNPSRLDGYVRDKMAVVGDPQTDGMPNPEVISNPTGAPISVTPMRDLQGGQQPRAFATGTGRLVNDYPDIDDGLGEITGSAWRRFKKIRGIYGLSMDELEANRSAEQLGQPIPNRSPYRARGGEMPQYAEGTTPNMSGASAKPAPSFHEKTADGIAKLLQHVQDPQTMHRLVDELSEHRGRLEAEGSQSQQSMPHYAGGTQDRNNVMGMELPTGGGGPIGGGSGRGVTKPSPTTTPLEQAQLINELRGTMDMPQDNARGNRPENRLVNYLEGLFQSANGMSYSDYARTQHPNGVPYNPNTPGWSSLPKGWEAVIDSAKGLTGYSYGTSRLELPHYSGGTDPNQIPSWAITKDAPYNPNTYGNVSQSTFDKELARVNADPNTTSTYVIKDKNYQVGGGSYATPGYVAPKQQQQQPAGNLASSALYNPWGSVVTPTKGKVQGDFARLYPKYNNLGGGGIGTADYFDWLGAPLQEGDSNYVAPIVPKTQAEIIAKAETNLPPAIKQLFGGRLDPAFDTTTNVTNNPQSTGIDPLRMGFNLFTPQALGQLTNAEKQALNSYLATKYNTTLEDVVTGMQQSFGQGNNGNGARMRVGRLG